MHFRGSLSWLGSLIRGVIGERNHALVGLADDPEIGNTGLHRAVLGELGRCILPRDLCKLLCLYAPAPSRTHSPEF